MGAAQSRKELKENLTDALIQIKGLQGFNAQLEHENKQLKARICQLEEMLHIDSLNQTGEQKETSGNDKGKIIKQG